MREFGLSMLLFWICYTLVTLIGILHTLFNIYVLKMSPMNEDSMGMGYEKTKPWHPVYNIVLFSFFGWVYLRSIISPDIKEAFLTGIVWFAICFIFDIIGWVIIKHPWSLSFKEFYIDYQPWITLIYLAILAGPLIAFFFVFLS